ncbi:MAG TPA: LPP20 family lipoprotein [Gammaproteobacteria bacterium]|nr:LPP20 family lipoprotein [Gammaproteobacteria bacterium]
MNTRTGFVCIALLGALAACSQAPKPDARPDWVLGQSAQYPASRFITGRGQADDAATARDRARADLAKTFSVQVSEASHDTASFAQSGAGTKNTLDVSRDISTHTRQMLRGVEIADIWRDPHTQLYYALATLSRAKAAAALRTQIGDLDAGTRGYLAQAQTSSDLLVKIAAASHAVAAQTERAELQRELQVADLTGRGLPPPWSLGKLEADRSALLAQLTIVADATGQEAGAVRKLLAGALADAGFSVTEGGDYAVSAELEYHALPERAGWYWLTGSLQVSMHRAGAAHGIRRWALKVSASDASLAKQRLMDQVAADLQQDIQATVLDFASGTSH